MTTGEAGLIEDVEVVPDTHVESNGIAEPASGAAERKQTSRGRSIVECRR